MVKKSKKKLSEEEKEELAAEGELPKRSMRKSEDKQLAWVVGIIVVVFVFTLVTYFWFEKVESFEFGGVDWVFEEDANYYHGRFDALLGQGYVYNIYLRNDPRENNVPTEGVFGEFKYGVVISTSPEFDLCRGDASRVMRDLGAFMREGFGAGPIESGSTNEDVANSSERRFATCDSINDRTVIIVKRGDNFVARDGNNPTCYVVSVGNCDDASAVEKFMLKVISDFKRA